MHNYSEFYIFLNIVILNTFKNTLYLRKNIDFQILLSVDKIFRYLCI